MFTLAMLVWYWIVCRCWNLVKTCAITLFLSSNFWQGHCTGEFFWELLGYCAHSTGGKHAMSKERGYSKRKDGLLANLSLGKSDFYLLLVLQCSCGTLDKASKPGISVCLLFSFSGSPALVWDAKEMIIRSCSWNLQEPCSDEAKCGATFSAAGKVTFPVKFGKYFWPWF